MQALHELLCDLFDSTTRLNQFLVLHEPRLGPGLSGDRSPVEDSAFVAIDLLWRQGRCDRAFFGELLATFPGRGDDIVAAARACGIEDLLLGGGASMPHSARSSTLTSSRGSLRIAAGGSVVAVAALAVVIGLREGGRDETSPASLAEIRSDEPGTVVPVPAPATPPPWGSVQAVSDPPPEPDTRVTSGAAAADGECAALKIDEIDVDVAEHRLPILVMRLRNLGIAAVSLQSATMRLLKVEDLANSSGMTIPEATADTLHIRGRDSATPLKSRILANEAATLRIPVSASKPYLDKQLTVSMQVRYNGSCIERSAALRFRTTTGLAY